MKEKRLIKIAPSLLSADFGNLASEIRKCEEGGADILHADIMDGHFVPNISYGPMIVEKIRPLSKLPIDSHLMITDPDKFIPMFVDAGTDMISIHAEGAFHIHRTLSLIKSYGKKAGLVLNPATPLEYAYEAAEFCDYILLMSVNPGFGGQSFIDTFLRRCGKLREYLDKNALENVEIEVDGGVKFDNIQEIVKAGANMIVCGSGLFKGDPVDNIKRMRKLAEEVQED